MSLRNFTKLGLAVLVVSGLLSWTSASAWTCNGTLTLATSDDGTSPGSICGGSYQDTWYSDNVDECLQEGTNDHLSHTWEFANIPGGVQSLIWEGHRPSNTDGDNFKFSAGYEDANGLHFVLFPGAVISTPFEPVGGIKTSMGTTTIDDSNDWYIYIKDTASGGSHSDTVYIDYLAICTE